MVVTFRSTLKELLHSMDRVVGEYGKDSEGSGRGLLQRIAPILVREGGCSENTECYQDIRCSV